MGKLFVKERFPRSFQNGYIIGITKSSWDIFITKLHKRRYLPGDSAAQNFLHHNFTL